MSVVVDPGAEAVDSGEVWVDTHTHVVAPDESAYPFTPGGLPGRWYLEAPHSAEDLLERMDAASVARAVLVQGVGAYSFDNRYAADSAEAHPDRFASACCIDDDGDDPVGTLCYWIRDRGMNGVRLFALSEGASWLADSRTWPLWERASDLGAHVIVTILAPQIPELRAVLAQFPETPVSLDHCGFPTLGAAPWNTASSLFELASFENLYLKVSTHVLDAASEHGDPGAFVAELVRHFGAARLMWGSDFCQTHDRSYEELVRLARRSVSGLSPRDRALIAGETALSLWPVLSRSIP